MSEGDRDRNIVAAICYIPILSVVISIVILFVEKDDKFIRFHAIQALLLAIAYFLFVVFIGGLPFVGTLVSGLAFLTTLVIGIYAMVNCFHGRLFKLPIIGAFAERKVR